MAYESSLPANKQVLAPGLAVIQESLAAAQAEQSTAGSGEASRAAAAEIYRQTLTTAKNRLNVALLQLKAKYAANQALLEGWGLDTVPSAVGISVRKPRTENEWITFLASYVAKETSLDANNRLTEPPLAEMTALNTTLQAAKEERKAGSSQRQAAVEIRTAVTNRLLDLLQAAALILVVTQFDGSVTNQLESWGFHVVARTTPGNGDTEPIP